MGQSQSHRACAVIWQHLREAVFLLVWLAGTEVLIFFVPGRAPILIWTVGMLIGYWLGLRRVRQS